MIKPTMAFVDEHIHQLTKSGDFMMKILSEHFEVTRYWDDYYLTRKNVPLEELNKYEYVFFWQTLNSIDELKKITGKIIWVPLSDGYPDEFNLWKLLASDVPMKILSFSKKMTSVCERFGIPALTVKYYLNPVEFRFNIPKTGRHLFFWYRSNLYFKELKNIIFPAEIDSFIYRSNPDIAFERELIDPSDIEKFKIKLVETKYTTRKEYFDLLSQANIFISPRKKEGIGLSFIEAMAMGMVVIGYNNPTMNEYIKNGVNGYLFDRNTKKIDFSDFDAVMDRSKKSAEAGYKEWLLAIPKIIEYIKTPAPKPKRSTLSPIYRGLYEIEKHFPVWQRTFLRYAYKVQKKLTGRMGMRNDK